MSVPPLSWSARVRQFRTHLTARVAPDERAALAGWLQPDQLALFDGMHVADRRHGLDVAAALRVAGTSDQELLLAGLLHDCAKGPTVGVWPRVAWTLAQSLGPWVVALTRWLPGFAAALDRLRDHADMSADAALAAGCSPRTAELIRHQSRPLDPLAGELLRLADEAN